MKNPLRPVGMGVNTCSIMPSEKQILTVRPGEEVMDMIDQFRDAQVADTTITAATAALVRLGFEQWAKARQPEQVGE